MEVVQLLGSQGTVTSYCTRYSGEVAARAAGNSALKGMTTNIGQYTLVFFPGEPHSLTEKPGRSQTTGSQSQT